MCILPACICAPCGYLVSAEVRGWALNLLELEIMNHSVHPGHGTGPFARATVLLTVDSPVMQQGPQSLFHEGKKTGQKWHTR